MNSIYIKLKNKKAKSAKPACLIKVTRNNLTGDFVKLDRLGNDEFKCYLDSVGTYRAVNKADTGKYAKRGCFLVYKYDGMDPLTYLHVSDEVVKNIPEELLQDADHINQLGTNIHNARFD